MRVNKILKKVLGLGHDVVIVGRGLVENDDEGVRPKLEGRVRLRAARRGRCGRCGTRRRGTTRVTASRWRHLDVGYATCELIADARRVDCPEHGPTVVAFGFTRHNTSLSLDAPNRFVEDGAGSDGNAP